MPETGLRAWIGEVERKLGARTRVMLALAAIAIGAGGAAVYIAVEAHDQAVSESDVRALQQRLEARIDQASGTAGGGAAVTRLETELGALKAEVEALKGGATKKGATTGIPGTEGPAAKVPGTGTTGPTTEGSGTEGSATEGPTKKAQPPSSGSSKR